MIYTAIFGDYDKLKPFDAGCEKYCITDQDIECDGWKILKVKKIFSNILDNRFYKFTPELFFHDEITLYIDANVTPKLRFNEYLDMMGDYNICITKHNKRNCLYTEAEVCKKWKKDNPKTIDNQVKMYRNHGFPENYGLFANGFILRKPSEETYKWGSNVLYELINYSKRDQLCGQYVAWKLGTKIKGIPRNLTKCRRHGT
jgi:hypothetical protein